MAETKLLYNKARFVIFFIIKIGVLDNEKQWKPLFSLKTHTHPHILYIVFGEENYIHVTGGGNIFSKCNV